MSDLNALNDLASFVGKSPLTSDNVRVRRAALRALHDGISRRPAKARMSDLLATVMALSARTKRVVQPRVDMELDVFSPGGRRRAVKISFGAE